MGLSRLLVSPSVNDGPCGFDDKYVHLRVVLVEGDGSKLGIGDKIPRSTCGWTCHHEGTCGDTFFKAYLSRSCVLSLVSVFYHRVSGCMVELLSQDIQPQGFYLFGSILFGFDA